MVAMGAAPVVNKLSVEEYLRMDDAAQPPFEYHDGEVFQIDGASYRHALICINFGTSLTTKLAETACRTTAGPRVRTSRTSYVHPDLVVVRGRPVFTEERSETITNPRVVIEILSPSTADYDFGGKLALYRGLPSIEEYILVAQDGARIDSFRKTADGNWLLSTVSGLDATLRVESLNISVPLAEIYFSVEFPPSAE